MGNQIADGELAVEVKGLSHWYGSQRVLNDVNLKITAGRLWRWWVQVVVERARC